MSRRHLCTALHKWNFLGLGSPFANAPLVTELAAFLVPLTALSTVSVTFLAASVMALRGF